MLFSRLLCRGSHRRWRCTAALLQLFHPVLVARVAEGN